MTTTTIPYDQQGYNIVVSIIKINMKIKKQLTWEWSHSHKIINTPGEWENSQEDQLLTMYMEKFETLMPTN